MGILSIVDDIGRRRDGTIQPFRAPGQQPSDYWAEMVSLPRQQRRKKRDERTMVRSQSFTDSRLPLELFECILDFVQDSRPTLCTVSLVCQAWLPRARRYLFQRIDISERRGYTFLKLLRSPYCTFSSSGLAVGCIQTVRIQDNTDWSMVEPMLLHIVQAGKEMGRGIRQLEIAAGHVFQNSRFTELLASSLENVVDLDLYVSCYPSRALGRRITWANVMSFISAFQRLEVLRIETSRWSLTNLAEGGNAVPRLPTTLQTISVSLWDRAQRGRGVNHALRWLLGLTESEDASPRLRTLELLFDPMEDEKQTLLSFLEKNNRLAETAKVSSGLQTFGTVIYMSDLHTSCEFWAFPSR